MRTLILFLLLACQAHAAVSVKVGSFTKQAGTGDQTVSWSDGDVFTPKAVIFLSAGNLNFEDNAAEDSNLVVGLASASTKEATYTPYMRDNVATSDNNKNSATDKALIASFSGVGTAASLADFGSFGSRQFTINWSSNDGGAHNIVYVAIGGDSIAEANVSNHTLSTGTGSQTYAHGLSGGAPDFVFFITTSVTTTGLQANTSFTIGAATSSTSRWSTALSAADAAGTTAALDALKQQSTSHCLIGISPGGGSQNFLIDYASDDATNVTLDQEDAPAGAYNFSMLAIRGGDWTVGATNKQTSGTGVQVIATGAASTPAVAFMASFNAASTASIISDAEMTIGVAQTGAEYNFGALQEDETLNTQSAWLSNDTKAFRMGATDASTYTVSDECDFNAFTSDGFSVNWTTLNTGIAEQLLWFTAGPASASAIVPILATQNRQRRQ